MGTTAKIDLVKQFKHQYTAPKKPVILEMEPARYMAVTGQGQPGGETFRDAVQALYAMAYTVKMRRKAGEGPDYMVSKLEALVWVDGDRSFAEVPKEEWHWTMMIRTPEFVTETELEEAAAALSDKGKTPTVNQVGLRTIEEGRCVQMLHTGPYDREGETVALMQNFAAQQDLTFHMHHHEIYLSDPRRIPPERLRTILRHPVKSA